MNKLVYGVGINDLPYRAQAWEWVTENGGKKNQEDCFSMQILYSMERHVKKML
jgi:hypothetical protein